LLYHRQFLHCEFLVVKVTFKSIRKNLERVQRLVLRSPRAIYMTEPEQRTQTAIDFPVVVHLIIILIGAALASVVFVIGIGCMIAGMGGNSVSSSNGPAVTKSSRAKSAPIAAFSLSSNSIYRHNPANLIAEGKQSFDVLCVACHQADGVGKVGFAPNIRNRDFLALASDDFLYRTIAAGRPGTSMTPWAHLDQNEIAGLIAYLRSGEDKGANQRLSVDPKRKYPGDKVAGSESYQTYCSSCHGTTGTGYAAGGSGPGIGLPGFLVAASDDYIFQTVKHGRIGSPMRSFMGPEGLANLSPDEVANIIAYLRSGEISKVSEPVVAKKSADPERGAMHFTANCMACHQEGGTGKVGFAPSIRNRDFLAISSDEFIIDTVRKGRPGTAMVQRPDLSDEVLADIISYLRSIKVANIIKVEVDATKNHAESGDAEKGGVKYAAYCGSCHGEKGAGYVAGGSGPAIGLAGFLSTASDDYIFQTLKIGRIGTAMRPFIGAAGLANLSEQDAFDIIAYLRSLELKTASN
jgi:mono/diheme cytochrome c family protein